MNRSTPLAIALAAGLFAPSALAQDRTPTLTADTLPAKVNGHIYFNIITGERVFTNYADGVRPVDGAVNPAVWIADNNIPCAVQGQTSGTALVVDAPNGDFGFPTVEGNTTLDWADIASDTVIDCVQISWYSALVDTDTDSDSQPDGIEGFAATWSFYDADNGFNTCLTRTGLVAFTLTSLPGELVPGDFGGYIVTLDLAASFGSSLAFELGDTDSNLQTAAFHNAMINADADSNSIGDADLDSDGNADWSMTVQFIQPGTEDLDSDSVIDGDVADKGLTALGIAAPAGTAVDNGDGTWSISLDPGVNAHGAEDAFDQFDSGGNYLGSFNLGGFSCELDEDGPENFAQLALIMYGPNSDGAFIGDASIADFDGDGDTDINDVNAFIGLFNAGCP
jgi:hypothetical protein